jgi:hypothetical protein
MAASIWKTNAPELSRGMCGHPKPLMRHQKATRAEVQSIGGARGLGDQRSLANGRERVAQLVRECCQEFVAAINL